MICAQQKREISSKILAIMKMVCVVIATYGCALGKGSRKLEARLKL